APARIRDLPPIDVGTPQGTRAWFFPPAGCADEVGSVRARIPIVRGRHVTPDGTTAPKVKSCGEQTCVPGPRPHLAGRHCVEQSWGKGEGCNGCIAETFRSNPVGSRPKKGTWVVKRKTARGRFRRALRRISDGCRRPLHEPMGEQYQAW